MANLKIELSKLDSEAWPGALDIEKEKLMLIHEKEELLKELQFVTPQTRSQDELGPAGGRAAAAGAGAAGGQGCPEPSLGRAVSGFCLSLSRA